MITAGQRRRINELGHSLWTVPRPMRTAEQITALGVGDILVALGPVQDLNYGVSSFFCVTVEGRVGWVLTHGTREA